MQTARTVPMQFYEYAAGAQGYGEIMADPADPILGALTLAPGHTTQLKGASCKASFVHFLAVVAGTVLDCKHLHRFFLSIPCRYLREQLLRYLGTVRLQGKERDLHRAAANTRH